MNGSARFPSLFFRQRLNAVGIPFLLSLFLLLILGAKKAGLPLAAAGLILLLFAALSPYREMRLVLLCAVLGIGLALGRMGICLLEERSRAEWTAGEIACEGYVTGRGEGFADLNLTEPVREKVRVYTESPPAVGDRIRTVLSNPVPVSESDRMEGVHVAFASSSDFETVGKSRFYTWIGSLRDQSGAALGEGEEAAFARAILVGDHSALSRSDRLAFRKTASSHLLAVSGLHISRLLGFLSSFLLLFPLRSRHRRWALLGAVWFLTFFTGFSVSVFRAAFMASFPLVGRMLRRRSDSVTALVFAAWVLVTWEPWCILSPSFLLSFGSTFGILVAALPLGENLRSHPAFSDSALRARPALRLAAYVLESFLISSCVFVFTFPIQLFLFGAASPLSPLYALILIPLFSCCMLFSLLAMTLGLAFPALTEAVSLLKAPNGLFLRLVHVLAEASETEYAFGNAAPILVIGVLAVLAFLLIRKGRIRSLLILHAVLMAAGGLCFLIFTFAR